MFPGTYVLYNLISLTLTLILNLINTSIIFTDNLKTMMIYLLDIYKILNKHTHMRIK